MKKSLVFITALLLSLHLFAQTKGYIDKDTKLFNVVSNIRQDHQMFGYAKPNVKSPKLICISVFTKDVKDNKYHCPLGAYYDTSGLPDGDNIYFVMLVNSFAKMKYVSAAKKETIFYIKKSCIDFSM